MVRKKDGFKNFMRKLDRGFDAPKVDTSGFWFKGSKRSELQVKKLYDILSGNHLCLFSAFGWGATPQGDMYWSARWSKDSYLSPEDYAYIQYLIDHHS